MKQLRISFNSLYYYSLPVQLNAIMSREEKSCAFVMEGLSQMDR